MAPIWGDYWVIEIADDYSWVIVGEPARRYGWILARSTELDPTLLAQLEQRMQEVGYDISELEHSGHTAPSEPSMEPESQ